VYQLKASFTCKKATALTHESDANFTKQFATFWHLNTIAKTQSLPLKLICLPTCILLCKQYHKGVKSFLHHEHFAPFRHTIIKQKYITRAKYVINTEKFWHQVILISNVAEHLMWSTRKIYFHLLHWYISTQKIHKIITCFHWHM
jgi:hypothetical protein